jgi:Spy/CpxP family protein refolding chaperone
MNPKLLLSLSLVSAGLALSQAALRADDAPPPPAPPPPMVDGPPAVGQTPPADSQTPPPQRRRGHRPLSLAELTQKLNLTADQQKTIGPIIANARSEAKELHDDESMTPEDKRARMKDILATSKAQIRAALTPDQQKVFDALPQRGAKGGQGAEGNATAPTPTPTQ